MSEHYRREAERERMVVKLASASIEARERLIRQYQEMSEAAFAPETLRNYKQITRTAKEWFRENGYQSEPPIPPEAVASYVTALGGIIRPTTIETRLWAIAELHRANFQPNPCRHRLVELSLKAVKRKYGAGVRQAVPLCKHEVLKAIRVLGNSRINMRDKAVLWVASDSWCRASEVAAFKVKDLIRQPNGSSLLFVARSKTDPYGEGEYAFLSEPGTEAVLRWTKIAGLNENDPLLTKAQPNGLKTHLHKTTISRIMKRAMGRRDISCHSTRVGGVHDAFERGCDLSSIMIAGRWTSPEMPARYGRKILASKSAAAFVANEIIGEEEWS